MAWGYDNCGDSCWLKGDVPSVVESDCKMSGVITAKRDWTGAYGPIEWNDRSGNDMPNMPVTARDPIECQKLCHE